MANDVHCVFDVHSTTFSNKVHVGRAIEVSDNFCTHWGPVLLKKIIPLCVKMWHYFSEPKWWPLFYREVRKVVDHEFRETHQQWQKFNIAGFLLMLVRLLIASYVLYTNQFVVYQKYELYGRVFNRSQWLDSNMTLGLSFFFFFALFSTRQLHFSPVNTYSWQVIYDLVVRNVNQFIAANIKKIKWDWNKLSLFTWLKSLWHSLRHNKFNFNKQCLLCFPNMHHHVRIKAIYIMIILEIISFIFFFASSKSIPDFSVVFKIHSFFSHL